MGGGGGEQWMGLAWVKPVDGCLTSGAVVVLRRRRIFAVHPGQLIRVAFIPKGHRNAMPKCRGSSE